MVWNDLLTIGLAVITVLSFALGRNDKSNKDTETTSYKQGVWDEKFNTIFAKLDKIEKKLDNYDSEIDNRIDKALAIHIREYHKKEKGV